MDAMIVDIRRAIKDPTVSLDHILDRSFYFRFHPKIELTPAEKELADAIRAGLGRKPEKEPVNLLSGFKRLFGSRNG